LIISCFGEVLWKPPLEIVDFESSLATFMGQDLVAVQDYNFDQLPEMIRVMSQRIADAEFSPNLYLEFCDSRLRNQNFLKVINPALTDFFNTHVAVALKKINYLKDFQKKSFLAFTKSDWQPDELNDLMNPRINITNAQRTLVNQYIDG
jgi:hypothetical protein